MTTNGYTYFYSDEGKLLEIIEYANDSLLGVIYTTKDVSFTSSSKKDKPIYLFYDEDGVAFINVFMRREEEKMKKD